MSTDDIRFTIDRKTLRDDLAAVIPHADPSTEIVSLNAVHFEIADGMLYLIASDRYTLAVTRRPITDDISLNVGVVIPLRAIRHLTPLLTGTGDVAVNISEDGLTVDDGDGTHHLNPQTHHVDATERRPCEVLNWRSLIRKVIGGLGPHSEPARDSAEAPHVNPAYLARFRAVVDRRTRGSVELHVGDPCHPILIAADHFLGALMPVVAAGEPEPDRRHLSSWRSALGNPELNTAA